MKNTEKAKVHSYYCLHVQKMAQREAIYGQAMQRGIVLITEHAFRSFNVLYMYSINPKNFCHFEAHYKCSTHLPLPLPTNGWLDDIDSTSLPHDTIQ